MLVWRIRCIKIVKKDIEPLLNGHSYTVASIQVPRSVFPLFSRPLRGWPVLNGHYPLPRAWPFYRGWTAVVVFGNTIFAQWTFHWAKTAQKIERKQRDCFSATFISSQEFSHVFSCKDIVHDDVACLNDSEIKNPINKRIIMIIYTRTGQLAGKPISQSHWTEDQNPINVNIEKVRDL